MKKSRFFIFGTVLMLSAQSALWGEETVVPASQPEMNQAAKLERAPQPIALETAGLEKATVEASSGEAPKAVPYRPKTNSEYPKVKVFKDFASTPIVTDEPAPSEEAFQPEKASKLKDIVRGTFQFLKDATRISLGAKV